MVKRLLRSVNILARAFPSLERRRLQGPAKRKTQRPRSFPESVQRVEVFSGQRVALPTGEKDNARDRSRNGL
jgi:hypothetical protein